MRDRASRRSATHAQMDFRPDLRAPSAFFFMGSLRGLEAGGTVCTGSSSSRRASRSNTSACRVAFSAWSERAPLPSGMQTACVDHPDSNQPAEQVHERVPLSRCSGPTQFYSQFAANSSNSSRVARKPIWGTVLETKVAYLNGAAQQAGSAALISVLASRASSAFNQRGSKQPRSATTDSIAAMDITVRVEVQYVAPERALVRDVLHMFRTPAWVRFMVRYISPHLKNAAPADKSVIDALASWRLAADADSHADAACTNDCVICMSDVLATPVAVPSSPTEQDNAQPAVQLPCGHCFHHGCIESWLKLRSTCPSCRFQFRKAFSGSYAVKTLNSALLLKPEHRWLAKDAILDASVGRETVRAVVHVTLSQIASQTKQSQYPCVLNALMMHSNGDSFTESAPVMDKAVENSAATAGAPVAASEASTGRVRTAYELPSERRNKRVRVH